MRIRKIEAIKHDEKWKIGLPTWQKIAISVLGYLPNKFWVYRIK